MGSISRAITSHGFLFHHKKNYRLRMRRTRRKNIPFEDNFCSCNALLISIQPILLFKVLSPHLLTFSLNIHMCSIITPPTIISSIEVSPYSEMNDRFSNLVISRTISGDLPLTVDKLSSSVNCRLAEARVPDSVSSSDPSAVMSEHKGPS